MLINDWNSENNVIILYLLNRHFVKPVDMRGHACLRNRRKVRRSGSVMRIWRPILWAVRSPRPIHRRTVFGLTFNHAATSGIEKRGGRVAVGCLVIPTKPFSVRASLARLGGRGGAQGREELHKRPVCRRGVPRQIRKVFSLSDGYRPYRSRLVPMVRATALPWAAIAGTRRPERVRKR